MERKCYGSLIIESVPDVTNLRAVGSPTKSNTHIRTAAAKCPYQLIRTRSLPPLTLPPGFRLVQSWIQQGPITAQSTPYRILHRIDWPVPPERTRIKALAVVLSPTCFVTQERVEVRMTEVIRNPVSISVAYGCSGIFIWTPSDVTPHAAGAACDAFVPSSSEIIHLAGPVLTGKWQQRLPLIQRNLLKIVAPV
jgi:hypothetical protein